MVENKSLTKIFLPKKDDVISSSRIFQEICCLSVISSSLTTPLTTSKQHWSTSHVFAKRGVRCSASEWIICLLAPDGWGSYKEFAVVLQSNVGAGGSYVRRKWVQGLLNRSANSVLRGMWNAGGKNEEVSRMLKEFLSGNPLKSTYSTWEPGMGQL